MKFIKKNWFKIRFIISLFFLVSSLIVEHFFEEYELIIALPLSLVGILLMSYDLVIEAFERIIKDKEFFNEETLTLIAAISSSCIGEFVDGLAVIMFFQLGEHFEEYALSNSKKSVESILKLKSKFARILISEKEKIIDPYNVKIGDLIIVKPGEIIPLDGIVYKGVSKLNTSSITGESKPISVKKGSRILSGTINLNNVIIVKVTKKYSDSTVNKILDIIENATEKKTNSEKFITKFAKIYTPIVISLAFIIAVIPPLYNTIFNNQNVWNEWIYRGASLLVIACPCALVISIPMSFIVSIGIASKNRIIIKGSTYLELLAKADSIYLDKTGTITEGKFSISEIIPKNIDNNYLLELACAGEYYSNHPIAKAILNYTKKTVDTTKIKSFKEIEGKGISLIYNKKKLLLGNQKLMKENKIKIDVNKSNGTIVYIAYNNDFIGTIIINDKIKNNSFTALNEFKKNGFKKVVMLTGDNENIAKNIASQFNILYKANLLPIDKTKVLKNNKNEINIFVGDGINDAPSLVLSSIGISMGQIGSDAAIEASDIIIMDDDLRKINYLKQLAKLNKFVVMYNIIFSILIKAIVLVLNSFGLLNQFAIIASIFADVGVTIICCINSLLISLKRK